MKIGIIGLGFVGSAIKNAYEQVDVELVLIDPSKGYNAQYSELLETDAVYIAVPSPQSDDGSCDTTILESVLDNLNKVEYNNVIISKVTAPPKVYDELHKTHNNLVHAPEFLTAVNANEDFINGTFAIIGGSEKYTTQAHKLILQSQPNIKDVVICGIGESSMSKYIINCYLATKVIFMNEVNTLVTQLGYNYDNIRRAIEQDSRIGLSHNQVPGPDGRYGFGGYCFPKDTSALLKFAENLNVDLSVLQSAVTKNKLIRN